MLWCLLACGSTPDVHPVDRAPDPEDLGAPEVDTAEPAPDTSFLYADVVELALDLDADAVDGLATAWGQDLPDVRATLTYGEESYVVGVHLRGGRGAFQPISGKPSFKLDFDAIVDHGRFHGLEHLTLDSMVEDPSMLATHASLVLYANLGHPAPRHGYAHLTVNGADYGLYGVLETPDEGLVEQLFGGVGSLYEGDADLAGENAASFRASAGDRDAAALDALLAAFDAAEPATTLPALDATFGADAFLDFVAFELAIGQPDGFVAEARGYDLHLDPASGRWAILPERADRAFYEERDVHGAWPERVYALCRSDTSCASRLDDRVAAVAVAWETSGLVAQMTADAARIYDACHADPRNPWGAAGCDTGAGALLDYLRRRPGQLHAAVGR